MEFNSGFKGLNEEGNIQNKIK